MRSYIRYAIYLIVLIGFSFVHAGSYDDFFAAIRPDNDKAVRALLQRGFDPNTLSPNGESALILALREPSFKVISALLENPLTQVELRTVNDESALMLAALRGYLDVCKHLIAHNADVNKTGWTPLHYAATGGHGKIVELLLDHHAYIDAASPNASTPLMLASKYGTIDVVNQLLNAGADPSIKNDLGLTAIDFAMQVQRDDIVRVISASVRSKRKQGAW
jgi:ankyrin repeat protein